jgi:tetratricopeptide (TPR) repeat protein
LKRLFWASLILLIVLVSCQTTKDVSVEDTSSSLYLLSRLEEEENRETRYNYIYSLYTEGEYEKVIAESEIAAEMYPEYTRFLKIKALAEKKTERDEAYSETLALILEKEPGDEELRDMYLESLLTLGKEDEAVEYAKKTILLYPGNTKAIEVLSSRSGFYAYLLENTEGSENE